jgi:uncharacterized SAM-binding protein YcdF (DUF218 family)
MNGATPRPNINQDKTYLDKVQGLIKGKGDLEKIHFEYLTELLTYLGIEKDIFTLISQESISDEVKTTIESAFELVNKNEITSELKRYLDRLWDYLAESDELDTADLIYVFGGISELAVREAIRLKKENLAPKILFSGKHGSYMKNVIDLTEAEKYANLALENGVKLEDILLEKESINTPENIVKSAALLHDINWLPKSVIAVSLPYHMKRASLTMRAGFDWDFKLIRHPGPSAKYTRENYFKDKNGWSYICFEYVKLYGARLMGHF